VSDESDQGLGEFFEAYDNLPRRWVWPRLTLDLPGGGRLVLPRGIGQYGYERLANTVNNLLELYEEDIVGSAAGEGEQ